MFDPKHTILAPIHIGSKAGLMMCELGNNEIVNHAYNVVTGLNQGEIM